MADAKIIISAVDKTKVAFDSVKRNVGSINGLLAGIGVGVSAGALTAMVKDAIDFADEMGKAAQKVGVTTEALSGLKYAADLSDVSFETLQQGLKKLSVNMQDAATGGKTASEAFKLVGVGVKDSTGNLKGADVVLKELAARFEQMPDGAEKTALAVKLLGKSGAELIPLLNGGADGIAAMTEEAAKFGKIVDSETARAAEQFNDDMTRLKASVTGVGMSIAKDLLPTLNVIAESLVGYTKSTDAAADSTSILTIALQAISVLGANVAYVFKQTGVEIGGMAAQMAALARGDFKGFSFIGDEMKRDAKAARQALDELEKRILNPQQIRPQKNNRAAPDDGGSGNKNVPKNTPIRQAVDQDAAAAARFVEQIKRQAEVLGLSEEELLKYEAAHMKLLPAQRVTVDAAIAQIGAFKQQQAAMKDMVDMQKFFDDEASRQAAEDLADIEAQAAAQEDINQSLRDFVANTEKAIDPTIELADNIGKIQSALSLGLISQEDAERLTNYLVEVKDKSADAAESISDAAKDLGLTFTSAFEDAITGAKSFSEVLKGLEADIIRIITRKLVTEPLANSVTGMIKDFDFGSIFGDIFGSANGNIMTPGGPLPLGSFATGGVPSGPRSGYLAMLHGTEAVVPLPDGRNIPVEMKGGGGVVVNMTINTPDANSFRKSQQQIASDMQRALNGARRVS